MRAVITGLRSIMAVSIGLLSGPSGACAATGSSKQDAAPAGDSGLVVHEWGTFTGFAGSDGVQLPFSVQIGLDLPPFVATRATQFLSHGTADAGVSAFLFSKGDLVAMERMETPVVYFYTATPREVSARVNFPAGLLTEFYPSVRKMTPDFNFAIPDKVGASSLDWGRIQLIPSSARLPGPGKIPPAEDSPYRHARETDSAIVQFSDSPNAMQEEKFLFYRGVGDFKMPVSVKGLGGDRFALTPTGPAPIAAAFIVRVRGGKAWFARYSATIPRQTMELVLPGQPRSPDELAESVTQALIAEGLYEREARAMVKTWQSSWFGEEGTRVLYIVPRQATDDLLPLTIDPAPKEMTRVMVGRLELLTPEQEARLKQTLTHFSVSGSLSAEEAREIQGLGRFQRTAWNRVVAQIGESQPFYAHKANEIQSAALATH